MAETNVQFSTHGVTREKGSLLTTIIATTGPRKTQMKWSSVESQHLIEKEEEMDLQYDIILGYCKFFSVQSLKSLRECGNRRIASSL